MRILREERRVEGARFEAEKREVSGREVVGLRAASGRFQGGCGRFQSQKWEVCWREGITRLPICEVSGRKAQGGWKVSGRKLVKIGRFEAEKGGGGGRFESEIRKVSGREEGRKKVSGREVDVSASTLWMMTPYSLSLIILTGDRNRFGTGALVPQTPPRRASSASLRSPAAPQGSAPSAAPSACWPHPQRASHARSSAAASRPQTTQARWNSKGLRPRASGPHPSHSALLRES